MRVKEGGERKEKKREREGREADVSKVVIR